MVWGGKEQKDDLGRRLRTPHGHEQVWLCCRQYPTRGAQTAVTLGWGVGGEGWFGGVRGGLGGQRTKR